MDPTRLVFLFTFLLFTLYLSTSNSCEIYKFVPSQNQTLQGHVIKTVVHALVNLCWRDCVWLSWCMSINVRLANHGKVECDLNNSSKTANIGNMVQKQGSQYHEMEAVDDQYCRTLECKRKEDLGDGWFRYGKAAIKLFQQMKNWTDARIFCRSLGGDLVSIVSSHENDFVYDLFVKGLNLTYGKRETKFPDVHWKFNGYEPGVSFGGTPDSVRYDSDDGEKALYFTGVGGFAEVPAVPLNVKGFTIALWLKHLNASASFPTLFTGSSSEFNLMMFINSEDCIHVETEKGFVLKKILACTCPLNIWCHYVFSWNKTEGWYGSVLNVKNRRKKFLSDPDMEDITRFVFGLKVKGDNRTFYRGSIKHFMLFNKSLSIHEIQTAMYWHEQGVWIGLNDQANNNTFQWSDGTPVSQFRPLPNYNLQPVLSGRKCVAMRSNREWLDTFCQEKKPFTCERPAP